MLHLALCCSHSLALGQAFGRRNRRILVLHGVVLLPESTGYVTTKQVDSRAVDSAQEERGRGARVGARRRPADAAQGRFLHGVLSPLGIAQEATGEQVASPEVTG